MWVFGGVATGKSVVAKHVLPSAIQNRIHYKTLITHFDLNINLKNSMTAKDRIREFESLVVKGEIFSSVGVYFCIGGLREYITEITEKNNLVITFDSFETLLIGLEISEKILILDYFEALVKDFNYCCVWIITGNFCLPWILHTLYNRTKHKILSQGAIYETMQQSADEDLKVTKAWLL